MGICYSVGRVVGLLIVQFEHYKISLCNYYTEVQFKDLLSGDDGSRAINND